MNFCKAYTIVVVVSSAILFQWLFWVTALHGGTLILTVDINSIGEMYIEMLLLGAGFITAILWFLENFSGGT